MSNHFFIQYSINYLTDGVPDNQVNGTENTKTLLLPITQVWNGNGINSLIEQSITYFSSNTLFIGNKAILHVRARDDKRLM